MALLPGTSAAQRQALNLNPPSAPDAGRGQPSPRVRVWNLGYAEPNLILQEGKNIAFDVREAWHGQDLNGDGDLDDFVLFVYDPVAREPYNTGLVADRYSVAISKTMLGMYLWEPDNGGDLNGNGVATDFVACVIELGSRSTHILGEVFILQRYAPNRRAVNFGGGRAAFLANWPGGNRAFIVSSGGVVSEILSARHDRPPLLTRNRVLWNDFAGNYTGCQAGPYVNLLHHAPVTGGFLQRECLTPTGSSGAWVADERIAAFIAYERAPGLFQDLNGDGDTNDWVPAVLEDEGGTFEGIEFSGWAIKGPMPLHMNHGAITQPVSEEQDQRDHNMDGDRSDHVLGVLDGRENAKSLVPAITLANGPGQFETSRITSDLVVAIQVEDPADPGTDLNGDGDSDDRLVTVLRRTDVTPNCLGLAINPSGGYLRNRMHAEGSIVAFGVDEVAQGGVDLNGNGKLDKSVLHVYDDRTRTIRNTGDVILSDAAGSMAEFFVDGTTVLYATPSPRRTPVVYFTGSGERVDLGLPSDLPPSSFDEGLGTLRVSESMLGRDLNGDGDTKDRVLHLIEVTWR